MKLKYLCEIKTNFPNADFWLIRKGSKKGRKGSPLKRSIIWVSKTLMPKYYTKKYNKENMKKFMGE